MDAYKANEKSKNLNYEIIIKNKNINFTCWILLLVSTCVIAVIMCPGVYPSDTLANELMSNPSLTCPSCFSIRLFHCTGSINTNLLLIFH